MVSPQEYREANRGEPGFRLAAAHFSIQLLPDPRRASYTYELCLETVAMEAATEWTYEIPTGEGEMTNVRAWDQAGGLQTLLSRDGGGSARLRVWLREPVRRGGRYLFSYGYETEIKSVVGAGVRTQTVTYADWLILNLRCDHLRVSVHLPETGVPIGAVPAADDQRDRCVRYEIRHLRPLEAFTFLVAYRKRKIGWTFWQWVASAVVSGLVGALISEAVGVWR